MHIYNDIKGSTMMTGKLRQRQIQPLQQIKHEQDLDIDLGLDVLGNLDIDLVSKSILYQYKTKIRKENLRKKI